MGFIVRSMYQPGLYVRSNAAQRECVSRMLREWAGRLRWSREEQEAVLDVGCGPGDVTAQLLLPRLPSSVRVLVGHDVSEEMVRHAAAAHAALAPRLCFLCTDIAARDLPATPLGACAQQLQGFHKVFSFYALHWVVDQRTALRNIHSLLRPGGEALLSLVANSPMFDTYITMQNNPRWCEFMQDAYSFMPPYKRSIDPVNDFSVVLQQAGFNIYSCRLEHFSYRYPTMQEFGDSTMVLNPFLKRVPEELKTIFINDFMREYQREKVKYMSMVSRQELEQNDTSLYHSVLITHVEKDNQDVS
ncbi:Juvenile hormone acid O-methyltransferase [Gryllus bimaculatus]|nr:Juvenile hormone acid O-methyltransferase [Gryllus bimaculatus]